MTITIEIPTKDFENWIDRVKGGYPQCTEVRNQVIEEGSYLITTDKLPAYSHDAGKYIQDGKVRLTIQTIPPSEGEPQE